MKEPIPRILQIPSVIVTFGEARGFNNFSALDEIAESLNSTTPQMGEGRRKFETGAMIYGSGSAKPMVADSLLLEMHIPAKDLSRSDPQQITGFLRKSFSEFAARPGTCNLDRHNGQSMMTFYVRLPHTEKAHRAGKAFANAIQSIVSFDILQKGNASGEKETLDEFFDRSMKELQLRQNFDTECRVVEGRPGGGRHVETVRTVRGP